MLAAFFTPTVPENNRQILKKIDISCISIIIKLEIFSSLTLYKNKNLENNLIFYCLMDFMQANTVRGYLPSPKIKLLANKRDVTYQSLMKIFLSERINKELSA